MLYLHQLVPLLLGSVAFFTFTFLFTRFRNYIAIAFPFFFFFKCSAAPRVLPFSPPRRSSDLAAPTAASASPLPAVADGRRSQPAARGCPARPTRASPRRRRFPRAFRKRTASAPGNARDDSNRDFVSPS